MVSSNAVNTGLSGASGTGSFAGTVSPNFTTPALGIPSSGNLASCTGYVPGNLSSITGTGAAVLAVGPTITSSLTVSRAAGGNAFTVSSTLSSLIVSLDVDSVSQVSLDYSDSGRGFVLNSNGAHQAEVWANGGQVIVAKNGVVVGGATGGDKGAGTCNFAADIYKNNTAYVNPDYVLELWATGKIEKFKNNDGAKGYQLPSLDGIEECIRKNYRLPGMTDDPMGSFARQDWLLEKMEEAFICIIELKKEIEELKRGK